MKIACEKRYLRVSVIFLLCSFLTGISRAAVWPVSRLGIENGLSNNSVRVVTQDRCGYMWFGTYDGLNRFDGYDFKIFRNKLHDSTSLPHNYIYSVHEDRGGKLWVGTGQGIGIYDPATAHFMPAYYRTRDDARPYRITANVNAVASDSSGNTFIGTNGMGFLLKEAGSEVAEQFLIYKNGQHTPDYNVMDIKIDRHQQVWVLCDLGLCLYDPVSKGLMVVNNEIASMHCFEIDDQDNIWVGTVNGLFLFNTVSRKLSEFKGDGDKMLSSNLIVALCSDSRGNLWIGTEGAGLNILQTATGKLDYILPGDGKTALNSESVFSIFEDREGRIWIGTLKGGLNIIDPDKSRFRTVARDLVNPNSLAYDFVSSFYEAPNGDLWVGTDGGGLSIWDRKNSRFSNFRHQPSNPSSLSNNQVSNILRDSYGWIWVATFGGGVNRYNDASGDFEHFSCLNEVTGRVNKNAWQLYEDRDKTLWVTTFSLGMLYRFNREKNRFETFDQQLYDLFVLKEDREGALWAGNAYYLIKIDKKGKNHQYFPIGKPVRAIHEDEKGNFWVGAEGGGLVLFDRRKGNIAQRYSDADGLSNNAVLRILEDGAGCLWLSTFNGLSKFDPDTKSFKRYYQDDGLQSNQFLYNAGLRLRSGEFVFGGIHGFNIFHPDSVSRRQYMPPMRLTGLRVNNQPVTAASHYVTKADGNGIGALEIPIEEAVLSFEFAALEYSAPGKISYAYFLEGWDKDWQYSGTMRRAHYTSLREGTYQFHIKSTNADGSWNPEEIQMSITVLPPWFRTWWAYLLYLFGAVLIAYAYLTYRSRQTKLSYEVEFVKLNAEKERAERQTEKILLEREKEINENRLSFFTNISHEFRTPLTLIYNPVKDLLDKAAREENEDEGDLKIVYQNARRLKNLVDQLLLFQKTDHDTHQLKVSRIDLAAICGDVVAAFRHQARSAEISLHWEPGNEESELYGDREKIEIILYNLLSNALKYTPSGGHIHIRMTAQTDSVNISVADSGCGIPKETGDQLFERFYQVQRSGRNSRPGFGIGLYLVKQFMESHKGSVSYKSELGKGTEFILRFRKGKDHFEGFVVLDETQVKTGLLDELVEDVPVVPAISKNTETGPGMDALITEEKSLLVVDDDAQIRKYMIRIFEGFTVHEAEDGDEGLKLARSSMPDLIISDIGMPGMSGVELCQALKNDPALSHIPVMLLTGTGSDEMKLRGAEVGADDYLTKPFEKELLMARVRNILKNRNHLQNYFYNEVTLQQNPLKIPAEYKEFLEKCMAIVEKHIDDENFNVKTLAAELGISHSTLYKKVKFISGQSINAFIRFIRLRKAAEILIHTNSNVNETAFQVGIASIKYFRAQFVKQFGMPPSEYIKKYRKAFGKSFKFKEGGYKN